jgi:hypothetical protein
VAPPGTRQASLDDLSWGINPAGVHVPILGGTVKLDFSPSQLSELLRAQTEGRAAGTQIPEDTVSTVLALAEPSTLARFLADLLAEPANVDRCAADSYEHALGFSKIVLIDAAPLFKLRLHVWWPTSSRDVAHIHNHRFSFASALVTGEYEMATFEPAEAGIPVTSYVERSVSAEGWRLDPHGDAYLRQAINLRLTPGSGYTLAPTTLHKVSVGRSRACVTLVLQTAIMRPATEVFTQPGVAVPAWIPVASLNSANYRRRLDDVLAVLTSESSTGRPPTADLL